MEQVTDDARIGLTGDDLALPDQVVGGHQVRDQWVREGVADQDTGLAR